MNLLSHIGDNVVFILNDVQATSMDLLTDRDLITLLQSPDPNSREMMTKRDDVYSYIVNRIILGSSYIDSIEVLGNNGTNISMDKYYASSFEDEGRIEKAKNLLGSADWTPEGQLGYFLNTREGITFLRIVRSSENLSQTLGSLLIHLRPQWIKEIYEDGLLYENSDLYIVDGNDFVISSNRSEAVGENFDEKLVTMIHSNPGKSYAEISQDGKAAMLFYQKVGTYDWYIVNVVAVKELLSDSSKTWMLLIGMVILCSIVSILMIVLYLKKVLEPLSDVSKAMKEIEKENYAIQIEGYQNDEIGAIAVNFNHMAQKLDELIKQVYSFKIKQRDAQITALRSQMNPHFLYNVLDMIVWKSRSEGAVETAEITREFSVYMRNSISDTKDIVFVEEEIKHLQHYINLQKIQTEDLVEFVVSVEKETEKCMIIGNILQPLVENALNYGIAENGGVGRIEVRVMKKDDILMIEVEDDGNEDLDVEELHRLMQQPESGMRGFAIKNINDRVQLMFGVKYGLEYERTDDGLTIARIRQPFILNSGISGDFT